MWGRGLLPASSYWVDGLIFHGGPIQGFPGNRNPLAFVALLLAICLVLRYMQTRRALPSTLAWLAACAAVFLLTQSATVSLSTAGCFIVIAALVVQRRVPVRLRLRVVGIFAAVGILAAIGAFFARRDRGRLRAQPGHEQALRHLARRRALGEAAADRRLGLVHRLADMDGAFRFPRDPPGRDPHQPGSQRLRGGRVDDRLRRRISGHGRDRGRSCGSSRSRWPISTITSGTWSPPSS